jgi:hypothetical protein
MNGQNENGPSVAAPEPLDQQIRKSSEEMIIEQSPDCKAGLYDLSNNGSVACRDAKVEGGDTEPAPDEDPLGEYSAAELAALIAEAEADKAATAKAIAAGEPTEPSSQILWRRDRPGVSTIHLPTHGPDRSAFHAIGVFYWRADGRSGPLDERAIAALLKLRSRRLLPFFVLIVNAHPDKLELCFDLGDPERLADFQRQLSAISWAFPWKLTARLLDADTVQMCDEAGLGLCHRDDVDPQVAP